MKFVTIQSKIDIFESQLISLTFQIKLKRIKIEIQIMKTKKSPITLYPFASDDGH